MPFHPTLLPLSSNHRHPGDRSLLSVPGHPGLPCVGWLPPDHRPHSCHAGHPLQPRLCQPNTLQREHGLGHGWGCESARNIWCLAASSCPDDPSATHSASHDPSNPRSCRPPALTPASTRPASPPAPAASGRLSSTCAPPAASSASSWWGTAPPTPRPRPRAVQTCLWGELVLAGRLACQRG